MDRIVPNRRDRATYEAGPVVLYLNDLEALHERIRHALGDACSFEVDIDGVGTQKPFTYTHKVATFVELRDVLGIRLKRGFSIGDGKGEFRLDFNPMLGFSAWAEGDRGLQALRIVEGLLNHKRRWFAPLLFIPAWKYIALYATLETTTTFLGERAGLLRVAMVTAIWWFVILVQPEWSAGQLSKLLLVRPHERTLLQEVTWKIVVPLFVGGTLLALRGCAAAAGIL